MLLRSAPLLSRFSALSRPSCRTPQLLSVFRRSLYWGNLSKEDEESCPWDAPIRACETIKKTLDHLAPDACAVMYADVDWLPPSVGGTPLPSSVWELPHFVNKFDTDSKHVEIYLPQELQLKCGFTARAAFSHEWLSKPSGTCTEVVWAQPKQSAGWLTLPASSRCHVVGDYLAMFCLRNLSHDPERCLRVSSGSDEKTDLLRIDTQTALYLSASPDINGRLPTQTPRQLDVSAEAQESRAWMMHAAFPEATPYNGFLIVAGAREPVSSVSGAPGELVEPCSMVAVRVILLQHDGPRLEQEDLDALIYSAGAILD